MNFTFGYDLWSVSSPLVCVFMHPVFFFIVPWKLWMLCYWMDRFGVDFGSSGQLIYCQISLIYQPLDLSSTSLSRIALVLWLE